MRKKVFGAVVATVLIVAQAVSAFAAGSKTAVPTVVGDSAGKYEISDSKKEMTEVFEKLNAAAPAFVEKFDKLNKGEETLETLVDVLPEDTTMTDEAKEEMKETLAAKELVTKFFDLVPIGDGIKDDDGKYVVSLSVAELTDDMDVEKIGILHYSEVRKVLEIVEPENVDLTEKEITAKFEDLSPVAVIVDKADEEAAK